MQEWRDYLPEAGIGLSAVFALWRLLGRQPVRSLISIKNRLFDLGALLIELQTCEADRRALEKALAHKRARDDLLGRNGSPDSAISSGDGGTAPSPTALKLRPRIRPLSPLLGRTKRGKSPTSPTDR